MSGEKIFYTRQPLPEEMLAMLNDIIIQANAAIYNSGMNGASNLKAEGEKAAAKKIKEYLFGDIYNT